MRLPFRRIGTGWSFRQPGSAVRVRFRTWVRPGRSRARRRSGGRPRGSPGRPPTRPGRPAAARRPAERPRARRRTPGTAGLGPDLPEVAFGADQAPLRGRILAPPLVTGPLPGAQRRLLPVQPVLRVGGPVAEHPHPRPELRREGAHPQVRARAARVRQRDEVVVVDGGAGPPEIDLRVHRVDRPEQLHRLVDEVRAEVEQDAAGLLRRRRAPATAAGSPAASARTATRTAARCRARPRPSAGARSGSRRPSAGSGTRSARRPGVEPPRRPRGPRRRWRPAACRRRRAAPPTRRAGPSATCDRFGVATTTRSTSAGADELVGAVEQRVPGWSLEHLRAPVRVGGHDGGQPQAVRRGDQRGVEDAPGQPVPEQTDAQR